MKRKNDLVFCLLACLLILTCCGKQDAGSRETEQQKNSEISIVSIDDQLETITERPGDTIPGIFDAERKNSSCLTGIGGFSLISDEESRTVLFGRGPEKNTGRIEYWLKIITEKDTSDILLEDIPDHYLAADVKALKDGFAMLAYPAVNGEGESEEELRELFLFLFDRTGKQKKGIRLSELLRQGSKKGGTGLLCKRRRFKALDLRL